MSKNLNVVLAFAKVIRIVTKVLFILCIVGGSLALAGAISLWAGVPFVSVNGEGISFNMFYPEVASVNEAAGEALIDAVICASEAVILGFTTVYFKNMLADKTPFTLSGAKEVLRLGILAVAIPTACSIACEIITDLLKLPSSELGVYEATTTVGILLIFLSFVFKYGAELEEKKNQE